MALANTSKPRVVVFQDGDEGGLPPTSPESPPHAAIGGDPTEAELQQMEQERLIVHLKEMIRQGEKTTIERDAELKVNIGYFKQTVNVINLSLYF